MLLLPSAGSGHAQRSTTQNTTNTTTHKITAKTKNNRDRRRSELRRRVWSQDCVWRAVAGVHRRVRCPLAAGEPPKVPAANQLHCAGTQRAQAQTPWQTCWSRDGPAQPVRRFVSSSRACEGTCLRDHTSRHLRAGEAQACTLGLLSQVVHSHSGLVGRSWLVLSSSLSQSVDKLCKSCKRLCAVGRQPALGSAASRTEVWPSMSKSTGQSRPPRPVIAAVLFRVKYSAVVCPRQTSKQDARKEVSTATVAW